MYVGVQAVYVCVSVSYCFSLIHVRLAKRQKLLVSSNHITGAILGSSHDRLRPHVIANDHKCVLRNLYDFDQNLIIRHMRFLEKG